MTREKFKRVIKPFEIKPGECIYGVAEIGLVYGTYGKDSDIYKAMVNGKTISGRIEAEIKKELESIEHKKKLLKMCLEREKLVEESQIQSQTLK